jgi:hypothetical protein
MARRGGVDGGRVNEKKIGDMTGRGTRLPVEHDSVQALSPSSSKSIFNSGWENDRLNPRMLVWLP